MAGTVEDIKAKTDIVQLISDRISVKKAGKHFKALCPFHGEKTPSFMISPELQIFKCFGCGESGDAITFLEKYEGMDFNEAISYLSEKTGIKLEDSNFKPREDKEKIIAINELAAKFYQYILLNHKLGSDALAYLTQKRKLTVETLRKFQIGYSPKDPRVFETFFIKKKGYKNSDLVLAGICYERYGRVVDRFSERVVFPLFDHRGNTVGFSGRIMPGTNPELAKYINTPETPAYHKSEVLFGLNFTKNDIKSEGFAIVTEGELDTISPWQRGIKNIVAIKGSALTEAHVRLLSRFTKKITLALDADFAGNAAAKRGIEIAWQHGLKVNVAVLKGYKDPDEMAVADIEKFKKAVGGAVSVYDFIINSAFEKYASDTIEGKIDISKEVVPILSRIEDEIVKAYYIDVLSKKLKVPYESVYSEVEKKKIDNVTSASTPIEPRNLERREVAEEALLILMLIYFPQDIAKSKKLYKTQFVTKVVGKVEDFPKRKEFNIKDFSESLPPELRPKFNEIYLINSGDVDGGDAHKIKLEIEALKKNLEHQNISQTQKEFIDKIKSAEVDKDKEKVKTLQKKLNDLIKIKAKLEAK